MARLKKVSSFYETATTRLAAMKSIDANLDLGNGLTVQAFQGLVDAHYLARAEYNTMLSLVDEKLNLLEKREKELKAFNTRMLNGVAAKYGKDSNEYEMAGGVRTSERKKPLRKKQA